MDVVLAAQIRILELVIGGLERGRCGFGVDSGGRWKVVGWASDGCRMAV